MLADVVDVSMWQRLQDHFARVLGIPLRTVTAAHRLAVKPSWPASLLNEQAITLLKAGEELEQLLPLHDMPRECTSITTPLGATYAAVPVKVDGSTIVAYFIVGPVVVGAREDELAFRQRVNGMGMNAAALWPIMLSLKLFTFASIRLVLDLLEDVGSSVAQLASARNGHAPPSPSGAHFDAAARQADVQPVADTFLATAIAMTGADGGSVMLWDDSLQALRIRASSGLPEEVILRTRIKSGEGLSGLVFAEGTPLLLDQTTQDARVGTRLLRPEIVSSVIVPIASEAVTEPVGVLNLRTNIPGKRLSQETLLRLKPLLALASLSLSRRV